MRLKTISTSAFLSIVCLALLSSYPSASQAAERLKPCAEPRYKITATPSFGQFVGHDFRLTASTSLTENDCFDVESNRQKRLVLIDAEWRTAKGFRLKGRDVKLSFETAGAHSLWVRSLFKVLARPAGGTIWRDTYEVAKSTDSLLVLNVFNSALPPGTPRIWPISK